MAISNASIIHTTSKFFNLIDFVEIFFIYLYGIAFIGHSETKGMG